MKKEDRKIFTTVWAYHHTCPKGKIYPHPDDIPEGWVDSPAKVKKPTRGRPKKNDQTNLDIQKGSPAKNDLTGDVPEKS